LLVTNGVDFQKEPNEPFQRANMKIPNTAELQSKAFGAYHGRRQQSEMQDKASPLFWNNGPPQFKPLKNAKLYRV
jgi:hypothetical protein